MKRLAEAGLLLVVLIWGVNFSVMKGVLAGLDPLVFNALRFTLSVSFLGILTLREQRPEGQSLRGSFLGAPVRLLVLGVLGHAAYQTTFILGLERTTAGNSALILSSSPLWTALLAHLARLERLSSRAWTGLGVAFSGTALLTLVKSDVSLGREQLVGDLLTVISAIAWGGYTAMSMPLLRRWSSLSLAFASMAVALPFLWLLALPGVRAGAIEGITPAQWGAVAYSGFLSTGLAYALWNVGIRQVGPAGTAVCLNLLPIVALAVGAIALEEQVTLPQGIGGALVLSGLVWVRRARAVEATAASTQGKE